MSTGGYSYQIYYWTGGPRFLAERPQTVARWVVVRKRSGEDPAEYLYADGTWRSSPLTMNVYDGTYVWHRSEGFYRTEAAAERALYRAVMRREDVDE